MEGNTMKIQMMIVTLMIATIMIGCGVTRPPMNTSGISFEYEGKAYRIESMTPQDKEGYNALVQKDGKKVILRAIDKEQDGILDQVVQGEMSLAEADNIYQHGIAAAKNNGNYKKRHFSRIYRTSDLIHDYMLRTYILAVGETYNMFSVQNKKSQKIETVVLDLAADGSLNKSETGDENVMSYQKLYQEILDKGLKEGKIVKNDEMYLVAMK